MSALTRSDSPKTKVRSQFGPAADAYATSDVHAHGESLTRLVEEIGPRRTWLALDVATGAGHTALALAPHVAGVVALDLTGQMLVKTRQLAAQRSTDNVQPAAGDGENLPFPSDSFDLVTCRLAMHHFPHPAQAIRECVRVLMPGGTLGLTDNITVNDAAAARYYNAYEQLRDPSHQWVYPLVDLQVMLESAGLRARVTIRLSKEFEFHAWADRQRVAAADKVRLLAMMRAIPASLQPLFAPRWDDGTLHFSLWEVVLVARKAPAGDWPGNELPWPNTWPASAARAVIPMSATKSWATQLWAPCRLTWQPINQERQGRNIMAYECQLIERPAQQVLSVRFRAAVQDLPQHLERIYGAIAQYLGELGEHPAGHPFAAYYNMDMQDLDIEAGFPVGRPLPGKGDMQAAEMPGGQAATCIHVGPYAAVGPAYEALAQFIKDREREASGVAYEMYLNDPRQQPPQEPMTQIVMPLKSA